MIKKGNFNVPVWEETIEEFNNWADTVAGQKGEKLAGALRAIQALHSIDEDLAARLMQPNITAKQAESLIRKAIVARETSDFLASLTPQQRKKVLLDAQAYKGKPVRKK